MTTASVFPVAYYYTMDWSSETCVSACSSGRRNRMHRDMCHASHIKKFSNGHRISAASAGRKVRKTVSPKSFVSRTGHWEISKFTWIIVYLETEVSMKACTAFRVVTVNSIAYRKASALAPQASHLIAAPGAKNDCNSLSHLWLMVWSNDR